MDDVKLLLCRGTPRGDIKAVNQWEDKIQCDQYHVKYMNEFQAYKQMRNYFLNHDYDYMVLATDDVEVRPEHIEQLKTDLDCVGYPVLGGMMNVDEKDSDRYNICFEIGMKDRKLREYYWLSKNQLPVDPIFPVVFNGFALLAIRRDVIQDYVFATDGIFRGTGVEFGASLDFVFCWYCKENKIPIMVDKRIDMKHWRASGTMSVGKKKPEVVFIPFYTDLQKTSARKVLHIYNRFKEQGGSALQLENDLLEALVEFVTRDSNLK